MDIGAQIRRTRLVDEVLKATRGREGLVPKKVTVTKRGKTFQQTVYVKPGEKPEAKKPYGVGMDKMDRARSMAQAALNALTGKQSIADLRDAAKAHALDSVQAAIVRVMRAGGAEAAQKKEARYSAGVQRMRWPTKEKPTEEARGKEPVPKLSMSSVRSAVKSSKDYATSAASAFEAGEKQDGVNYLKGMSKQLGDITYEADKAGLKIDPKVGEKIARLDDEILSITQTAKTGTPKGNAEAARGRAEDVDEIVKLLSPKETAKSGASMIMRRNHLISNSRF